MDPLDGKVAVVTGAGHGIGHALERYRTGVTVNAVGPSGMTRLTATMPGMPAAYEPDEVPEHGWRAVDPSSSSLAGDRSARVTGQVGAGGRPGMRF